MDVKLLYFDGCPNWHVAKERLRVALDRLGYPDVKITPKNVASDEEARELGFTGSPTILVDGRDPFAEPGGAATGLSCRVYESEEGMAGSPTVEQLVEVLDL